MLYDILLHITHAPDTAYTSYTQYIIIYLQSSKIKIGTQFMVLKKVLIFERAENVFAFQCTK